LRLRLSGDPTFADIVARARTATISALAHQELPFDRIVEIAHPDRSPTAAPLVQVLLALEELPGEITAGGATFSPRLVENGTAKFALALGTPALGSPLEGRFAFDTTLFDPPTARQLVDSLLAVARAIVAEPDRPMSAIELMDPRT